MSKIQTSLRIEEESLNEAKQILSRLGMNFSEAVNMFTCMIVEKTACHFLYSCQKNVMSKRTYALFWLDSATTLCLMDASNHLSKSVRMPSSEIPARYQYLYLFN